MPIFIKRTPHKYILASLICIFLMLPSLLGASLYNPIKTNEINEIDASKNDIINSFSSDIKIMTVDDGFNLAITFENKGNQILRNLKIQTKITGGILISPRNKEFEIPFLSPEDPNDSYTIQLQVVGLGFGFLTQKPMITIYYEDVVIGQIETTIFGIRVNVKNTILNEENSFQGYTLFTPEYGKKTYLISNNGEIIYQWSGQYIQGMDTELLDTGNLIRTDAPYLPHSNLAIGGFTGHVGIYNPEGICIWEYVRSDSEHCLHHGFEMLPNGNILMIVAEYKSLSEVLEAGCNPNALRFESMCPSYIIEVEPTGTFGGNIVWEWHVWDHLVQEYDPTKNNYGDISKNPQLIDINFDTEEIDFNHINSVDYNEELDQILLSVRTYNEIWVIDHSTTTEEAAGHSGGTYGKGGDLLYRWGNPQAYGAGIENDQQLFSQHDANWIPAGYPGEGNILVFNNQNPLIDEQNPNLREYSSVVEIVPPLRSNGSYYKFGEKFGPISPVWTYTSDFVYDFYSSHLSSARRLPNGNTLICEGNKGRFFEVTYNKDIVWQYQNTYGIPNHVFNIARYDINHPGIQALLNTN